ncbi:MAG: hypothetical protein K1Y36_21770 [Blastocatellia bacterium]|nr:hypothetical protein [Blastocatellia bacterium]
MNPKNRNIVIPNSLAGNSQGPGRLLRAAPTRSKLKNGVQMETRPTLLSQTIGAKREGTDYVLSAKGLYLQLKAKSRDGKTLAASARLAGEALADESLCLLTMLAFCVLHEELPDNRLVETIQNLTDSLPSPEAAAPLLSDREVAGLARQGVLALAEGAETLLLPPGNWNAARVLLGTAERLWQVPKEVGKQIGVFALEDLTEGNFHRFEQQRQSVCRIASLGLTAANRTRLSPPPNLKCHPTLIYLDWISLMWGPHQPPPELRPEGLGSADNLLALERAGFLKAALNAEVRTALAETAATLLARTDRPVPRYLGRWLEVPFVAEVLPYFQTLGVGFLRMQPEAGGIWVVLLDREKRSLTGSFWEPDPQTDLHMPLNFFPSGWALVHAVCSALWYDLCRESVRIESDLPEPHPSPLATNRSVPPTPAPVRLPVPGVLRQPEPTQWVTPEEARAIATAVTQHGRLYRRLPAGWEQRRDKVDWQQRQQRATARAIGYGCLPPPPGFTFVRPFTRQAAGAGHSQPRMVQSEGLFALALALQQAETNRTGSDTQE